MSNSIPQCRVRNHRGLEALGLTGEAVYLRVDNGVLHLSGTTGGLLILPPHAVRRLRLFREPPRLRRSGYDQIELWREGNHPPLSVDTLGGDTAAFREVVAAFARAVVMARGSSALQVGAVGIVALQQLARLLIGALAWLVICGGAMWFLTGLARAVVLISLLAIMWREGRRIRANWRAGSLWRRNVHDLSDFSAAGGPR